MDTVELAKALSSLPLAVLLVLVLVGGYVEWWIYGSLHRSQVADLQRRLDNAEARSTKWEERYIVVTGGKTFDEVKRGN